MRNKSIILIIFICLVSFVPVDVLGAENYIMEADILNKLGIFNGSDIGYELDRIPRRIEGSVLVVRILGKEELALNSEYTHPFSDVPKWADPYIGYLYSNNMTTGVDENLFGSNMDLNADQYTTFILRCLGYDDFNGDFKWDEAVEKARDIGLIEEEYANQLIENNTFTRNDVVHITYNAMYYNKN